MIIRYLVSFYSTKRDGGGNPVADIWLALLENDDTVIKELTPGTSQADALSAIAADLAIAYPSDTLELTGVVEDSIPDIQIELAGKAELVHAHAISDVTGLQAELDSHTHAISDVTGLQTALDADIAISKVTNLQTTLDGKSNVGHTHD